jgi:hypothetical protein
VSAPQSQFVHIASGEFSIPSTRLLVRTLGCARTIHAKAPNGWGHLIACQSCFEAAYGVRVPADVPRRVSYFQNRLVAFTPAWWRAYSAGRAKAAKAAPQRTPEDGADRRTSARVDRRRVR